MILRLILTPLTLIGITLFVSCGKKPSDASDGTIKGPVISGSKNSGAFITMNSPDSSVTSSSLYYYDFSNGAISKVSTTQGRDSISIWNSASKTVAFYARTTKSFHNISLDDGNPVDLKSATLTDLTMGDPTSWSNTSSDAYLLANLQERTIRSLETGSAYLSASVALSSVQLASDSPLITPTSIKAESASSAWFTASGVDFTGVTPNSKSVATVVKITKASGDWAPSDLDSVSAGVQGQRLNSSYPVYFEALSSANRARTIGLCRSDFGSTCESAADEVDFSTGSVTKLASFKNSGYEYFSWIIPGATDDFVYAHVTQSTSKSSMIVRINLITGAVKEIHTFTESSLSLLMYDKDADRLFVGEKNGANGLLVIFKAEAIESTVLTRELPYHGAFVPSL